MVSCGTLPAQLFPAARPGHYRLWIWLRWYLLPGLPQVYYIGIIDILMLCAPPSLSTRCTARPMQLALSLGRVHTRMHTLAHTQHKQTHACSLSAYGRMHAHSRAQTKPRRARLYVCRYVMRKRIENTWKSMTEGSDDPDGVSAKPPREYSTPFHEYPEYHDKPNVFRLSHSEIAHALVLPTS
jgi:hypothetical protein